MTSPPRARVVMMQKNEGPVLARWLQHYSTLFGYENLTVLDNCSTDTPTIKLLMEARHKGSHVVLGFRNYSDKPAATLEYFRRYEAYSFKTDFFIPVDCDEYLAVFTDTGLSTDSQDIFNELSRYKTEVKCLQIPGCLFNDPGLKNGYVMERNFVKSFFRSGAIGTLDHGSHFATSGLDPEIAHTKLVYLHHHNKELDSAKATARAKLVYAEQCVNNEGVVQYLRWLINLSLEDYNNRYQNRLRLTFNGKNDVTIITPDGTVIQWDGQQYLQVNHDVAQRYALGALHHYMSHGYYEGRRGLDHSTPLLHIKEEELV